MGTFVNSSLGRSNNILRGALFVLGPLILSLVLCVSTARSESSGQSTPHQIVNDINKCFAAGDAECVIEKISNVMPAYQNFESGARAHFEGKIRDTLVRKPNFVDSVIDKTYGSSVYVNISYINFPSEGAAHANDYLFVKYVMFRNNNGWDLTKIDFKQTGDFPVPEW